MSTALDYSEISTLKPMFMVTGQSETMLDNAG